MRAAVRGKRGSEIKILAVTVLTSLSDADLHGMGYRLGAQELVHLRVRQAAEYGCDGIIASPHDNPDELRRMAGCDNLLVVTPGVRSEGDALDDHKRTATPARAIAAGADYLVVGRPILARPDPAERAKALIRQMQDGADAGSTPAS